MAPDLPDYIRALFDKWSMPFAWTRLRHVQRNLDFALDQELAALLADPPSLDAPLPPTSDGVRRASAELDALACEHARLRQFLLECHPELLGTLPTIPPLALLDAAAAVRCAERVAGVYGRVLAELRADPDRTGNRGGEGWSRPLSVAEWRRVLGLSPKAVTAELERLRAAGRAERVTRQAWRVDLEQLDQHRLQKYAALGAGAT